MFPVEGPAPATPTKPSSSKHRDDAEEENEELKAELEEMKKHWTPPSAKSKITEPVVDPVAEEVFAQQAVNASSKPSRAYTEPRRRGTPKSRPSEFAIKIAPELYLVLTAPG